MTEENLTDTAPPSRVPKNSNSTNPNDQGGGSSGKSAQGGNVRTVDLPSKDVKPFSAEQLSGSVSGQKSQSPSSKAPGGSSGNKTPAKQSQRFIDDDAGEGEGGEERAPSAKGPKKAG